MTAPAAANLDPAVFHGRAAVRAGILVTGTEVLTGIISDRNGPWLSQRLLERGIDVEMIEVVGDRPSDVVAALRRIAAAGVALIITTGGLGPTADDLTAALVAEFCGRPMELDAALEARIDAIVTGAAARWPDADPAAMRAGTHKQAFVPAGAEVLEPRGTAPGLVVQGAGGDGPTVVVLPGPPSELQPMWEDAVATRGFRAAATGAIITRREMIRLYGLPEAEIASTLRAAAAVGIDLTPLEVTTCLRRGELEITTRFTDAAKANYDALFAFIEQRHATALFSRDGTTIDAQVATLLRLRGETIAVAESCTAGLLAARLTDRPGASAYVVGGAIVYSNRAKTDAADVDPALIAQHGAVSVEVAQALASGVRHRFSSSVGVGITGVAGPDGGTEQKPVGFVCLSACRGTPGSSTQLRSLTRTVTLPGDRAAIRDRATTVAMHLIAGVLQDVGA